MVLIEQEVKVVALLTVMESLVAGILVMVQSVRVAPETSKVE